MHMNVQIQDSPDGWKLCLQQLHQLALAKGPDQVKFWCINVALFVAQSDRYEQMTEEERNMFRVNVMVFAQQVIPTVPQSNLIKTKLSVLVTQLIKNDYPQRWPSFFHDFLGILNLGTEVVDVFFRVLKAIDQEVVDFRDIRSAQERDQSMRIKDAMRTDCITIIIQSMHGIFVACEKKNEELTSAGAGGGDAHAHAQVEVQKNTALIKKGLDVLGDYINWIDRDLIVNPMFLPLLYKYLAVPALQNEACQCIEEVIYKRMDPDTKLAVIKQINIIQVLGELLSSGIEKLSHSFAIRVMSLLNLLTITLNDCIFPPQTPSTNPTSVNNNITGNSTATNSSNNSSNNDNGGAGRVNTDAVDLMHQCLSLVLQFFSCSTKHKAAQSLSSPGAADAFPTSSPTSFIVLEEAMECLQVYMGRLKIIFSPNIAKFKFTKALAPVHQQILSQQFSPHYEHNVKLIIEGVFALGQLPAWYENLNYETDPSLSLSAQNTNDTNNNTNDGDNINTEDLVPRFEEFRAKLFNLFNQVTYISTDTALTFLSQYLTPALASLSELCPDPSVLKPAQANAPIALDSATLARVNRLGDLLEVCLLILYQTGAHQLLRPLTSHLSTDPLRSILGAVCSCAPLSYHPSIHVSLIYFQVIVRYAGFLSIHSEFIFPALFSFLDNRGMHHSSPTVRSRSCYLFLRFVKVLPPEVRSRIGLQSQHAQQYQQIISQIQSSLQSILGRSLDNARALAMQAQVASAGSLTHSDDDCLFLSEVLGIMISSSFTGANCQAAVQSVLSFFMSSLSAALQNLKEMKETGQGEPDAIGNHAAQVISCLASLSKPLAQDSKSMSEIWGQVLESICSLFFFLPSHTLIRSKTISFLHQMIHCLDYQVVPYLSQILEPLINLTDPNSVEPLVQLVSALITRYKDHPTFIVTMDQIFSPLVQKVFECIKHYDFIDKENEEIKSKVVDGQKQQLKKSSAFSAAFGTQSQQRVSLYKLFAVFLKNVLNYGLGCVLTSDRNQSIVETVVGMIVTSCSFAGHGHLPVNRIYCTVLYILIVYWFKCLNAPLTEGQLSHSVNGGGNGNNGAGAPSEDVKRKFMCSQTDKNNLDVKTKLLETLLNQLPGTCFAIPHSPEFELNDAKSVSCFKVVIKVQVLATTLFADRFINVLGEFLVSSYGMPASMAQEYCMAVMNAATALLTSVTPQQPGLNQQVVSTSPANASAECKLKGGYVLQNSNNNYLLDNDVAGMNRVCVRNKKAVAQAQQQLLEMSRQIIQAKGK